MSVSRMAWVLRPGLATVKVLAGGCGSPKVFQNGMGVMRSCGAVGSRAFKTGQVSLMESETASSNPQVYQSQTRMEKTVNNVTLMGRVGGDPQKRGNQEHPVVVFSVATHSNYNYQSGGTLQKTDWHRICVFKPYLRDTVYKYLGKGQRVYITGRISYGEVKDENGNAHTTTSIIADDVIFVSSPGAGSNASKYAEDEVD